MFGQRFIVFHIILARNNNKTALSSGAKTRISDPNHLKAVQSINQSTNQSIYQPTNQ